MKSFMNSLKKLSAVFGVVLILGGIAVTPATALAAQPGSTQTASSSSTSTEQAQKAVSSSSSSYKTEAATNSTEQSNSNELANDTNGARAPNLNTGSQRNTTDQSSQSSSSSINPKVKTRKESNALPKSVGVTISNQQITSEIGDSYSSIVISFDFTVPNSVNSGDTTVISLPKELNFIYDQVFKRN